MIARRSIEPHRVVRLIIEAMFGRLKSRLRRKASSIVGLPNIYHRLDVAERRLKVLESGGDQLDQLGEYLFLLETRIRTHQEALIDPVLDQLEFLQGQLAEVSPPTEARIIAVQDAIVDLIRLRSDEVLEQSDDKVESMRRYILEVQDALLTHLDKRISELLSQIDEVSAGLKRRISEQALVRTSTPISSEMSHRQSLIHTIDSALYQAFEDRYRGSTEVIRERQRDYVELIHDSLRVGRALDIGCGRGEWLEVLRGLGIDAYGIDSNPVSVNRCREQGLDVVVADALAHLATLSNESLGAVTLFQVVEHVPVAELPLLIREILRVLKPGGTLVAEFPNIQSVEVGANTFWLDPTHLRPLHPHFVEFVAHEVGFVSTHLYYPSYDDGLSTDSTAILSKSAPDVALIALK